MDFFQGSGDCGNRISHLAAGIGEAFAFYRRCLYWRYSGVCRSLLFSLFKTDKERNGMLPHRASIPGLLGGSDLFRGISHVDIPGRLSSAGIWHGEIYGLRFHGSHDAQHHPSGQRHLVFRGTYQLLLRRPVFCRISDKAFLYKG